MSDHNIDLTVDDGKYRIIQHTGGGVEILRHGQPWMGGRNGSFAGVNVVIAMACELEELRGTSAKKYSGSDAAVQIGEEAFRAGWDARSKAIDDYLMHDKTPDVNEAWDEFVPSEAVKDLLVSDPFEGAVFALGTPVQRAGADPAYRFPGFVCGYYLPPRGGVGYAVRHEFEPGLIHIFSQRMLEERQRCPTCINGAPESYGCTDCLNTGFVA